MDTHLEISGWPVPTELIRWCHAPPSAGCIWPTEAMQAAAAAIQGFAKQASVPTPHLPQGLGGASFNSVGRP
eukprot:1149315-Pelagomonas_calceolata.AAC.1